MLVEGDFRTFELDRRFDAASSLFSGTGYLTELEDSRSAIANMATHLTPDGVLLIEGWLEPDYWPGSTVHSESGVSFARLPHMLHSGRSVYVGVQQ